MSNNDFSECAVGVGVAIQGTIRAPGMVRIDGEFSGDITSGASVIISKNAVVRADISARDLIVAGSFSGTANVRRQVRYSATARVDAVCVGDALVMESGAIVRGTFSRVSQAQ